MKRHALAVLERLQKNTKAKGMRRLRSKLSIKTSLKLQQNTKFLRTDLK